MCNLIKIAESAIVEASRIEMVTQVTQTSASTEYSFPSISAQLLPSSNEESTSQAGREKWSHALWLYRRISSTRSASARLCTGDSHERRKRDVKAARQPDGEVVDGLVPMPPLPSRWLSWLEASHRWNSRRGERTDATRFSGRELVAPRTSRKSQCVQALLSSNSATM